MFTRTEINTKIFMGVRFSYGSDRIKSKVGNETRRELTQAGGRVVNHAGWRQTVTTHISPVVAMHEEFLREISRCGRHNGQTCLLGIHRVRTCYTFVMHICTVSLVKIILSDRWSKKHPVKQCQISCVRELQILDRSDHKQNILYEILTTSK